MKYLEEYLIDSALSSMIENLKMHFLIKTKKYMFV